MTNNSHNEAPRLPRTMYIEVVGYEQGEIRHFITMISDHILNGQHTGSINLDGGFQVRVRGRSDLPTEYGADDNRLLGFILLFDATREDMLHSVQERLNHFLKHSKVPFVAAARYRDFVEDPTENFRGLIALSRHVFMTSYDNRHPATTKRVLLTLLYQVIERIHRIENGID